MRRWAWLVIVIVGLGACSPRAPLSFDRPDVPDEPVVIPTLPPGFAYELLPGEVTFASEGDLYTFDARFTEPLPLFTTPAYETAPAWSPDGRSLAFASAGEGPADLYVASFDPDGGWTTPFNLTESPEANESAPGWAPDGSRLVYASRQMSSWGLFTIEFVVRDQGRRPVAGSEKRLTYSQRFLGHPDWSPIEPKIAFTSERGGRWEIMVISATGTGPSPFPGLGSYASSGYPAWSPDGSRLAFASTQAGNWDIYVINADGTGRAQLTFHPASDWSPVWSPDSRWIAFSSTRDGVGNVFIVRADGSETVRLTANSAFDHAPTWRPVDLMPARDR